MAGQRLLTSLWPGRREGCRDGEMEEGVMGEEEGEGSRGKVIEEKEIEEGGESRKSWKGRSIETEWSRGQGWEQEILLQFTSYCCDKRHDQNHLEMDQKDFFQLALLDDRISLRKSRQEVRWKPCSSTASYWLTVCLTLWLMLAWLSYTVWAHQPMDHVVHSGRGLSMLSSVKTSLTDVAKASLSNNL